MPLLRGLGLGDWYLVNQQLGLINYLHLTEIIENRKKLYFKVLKLKDPSVRVISLSLGFNFLPSCLKTITAVLAKTDTGLAAFMCSVPHVAHITVSLMEHKPPFLLLLHRHHLLPTVLCNIWRCGACSKLQWRSVSLHCCSTSPREPENPPQDQDRLCWQLCTGAARWVRHALSSVRSSAGRGSTAFHFQGEKSRCSVVWFEWEARNRCTRAWRWVCTAAWKECIPVVTSWDKNRWDSWLYCT